MMFLLYSCVILPTAIKMGVAPARIGGALFLVGLTFTTSACAPAHPAADYTAEGLICVDRSASRTELNVCRCDLEKRYARPLVHCDGGTP